MPNAFPEGTLVRPSDDEARTAFKWCQVLYDSIGNVSTPFPEGSKPTPGDDYQRLLKKINAMLRR